MKNDYQRIGDENANGINEWLGENTLIYHTLQLRVKG
jgi:hypothetical protein